MDTITPTTTIVEVKPAERLEPPATNAVQPEENGAAHDWEPVILTEEAQLAQEAGFEGSITTLGQYYGVIAGEDGELTDQDLVAIATGEADPQEMLYTLMSPPHNLSPADASRVLSQIWGSAVFLNENQGFLHALDVASGEGEVDGYLSEGDLEAAFRLYGEGKYNGTVAAHEEAYADGLTEAEAVAVVDDFFGILDTAAGEGGQDDKVSPQDLQALLDDPGVPESVKAAALMLLEGGMDNLNRNFLGGPTEDLDRALLQWTREQPPEMQRILMNHHFIYGRDRFTEVDPFTGQVVWADTGTPISAEEYQALAAVGEAEFGWQIAAAKDATSLPEELSLQVTALNEAYTPYQRELEYWQAFQTQYFPMMTETERAAATEAHNQRLQALADELGPEADQVAALLNDPVFQAVYGDMSEEQQLDVLETIGGPMAMTEAGRAVIMDVYHGLAEGGNVFAESMVALNDDDIETRAAQVVGQIALTGFLEDFASGDPAAVRARLDAMGQQLYGATWTSDHLWAIAEAARGGGDPAEALAKVREAVKSTNSMGLPSSGLAFTRAAAFGLSAFAAHEHNWGESWLQDVGLVNDLGYSGVQGLRMGARAINSASRWGAALGRGALALGVAERAFGALGILLTLPNLSFDDKVKLGADVISLGASVLALFAVPGAGWVAGAAGLFSLAWSLLQPSDHQQWVRDVLDASVSQTGELGSYAHWLANADPEELEVLREVIAAHPDVPVTVIRDLAYRMNESGFLMDVMYLWDQAGRPPMSLLEFALQLYVYDAGVQAAF